jgi:nucleoside phosphorylase
VAARISEILATTKAKDRTDQFLILAALFALDANKTAVAPKAIKEVLELHRARLPANLIVSLQRLEGLVEPVSGTPKTWLLLSAGVERLRELTGLPLPTSDADKAFLTDVGVVCALEAEFEALRDALGGSSAWHVTGDQRYAHVYRETTLTTVDGDKLRVVATVATSMGLTAAAIATSQLIAQFRPRIVVMVGIAAGTRGGNKQFGDVLVADPSVDYNSGKVVVEGGIAGFLPDPYPIGLEPRLRTVLRRYARDPEVFEKIRRRWSGLRPTLPNNAHIGTVGAADQVIDNPQVILEIQKHWRKLIGVEMETYAVYRACSEAPGPKPWFVSFKSVCDFAAEKTDSWQPYAAFMAAQFAAGFLRSQWRSLWMDKEEGNSR